MAARSKLADLPPNMAERAVRARTLCNANPKSVEIDDQMLPWMYDKESGLWLSFDGNYSQYSPIEKRQKAMAWEKKQEDWESEADRRAKERYEIQMAWSMIRAAVLERDQYTCQLCGLVGNTRLHVHHVLKRTKGGTDHMDNLLTTCNRCHKQADTKLYNPDWTRPPRG